MTGVRIGDLWQTLIDDPAAPLASPLAAAAQTESTPAVGEPLPLIEPRGPAAEDRRLLRPSIVRFNHLVAIGCTRR